MTERLDRIEALLESTTQKLDRTAEQQTKTQSEVSNLLDLFQGLLEGFDRTQQEIAESNQRFEVLRADAIADRQRSDARFETLRADAIADQQRSDDHFEALRADAIADRQRSDDRFEAILNRFNRALIKLEEIDGRVSSLEQRAS